MNQTKVVTTKCSAHNHPEFLIECHSAIPRVDVDHLISYLEESVGAGTQFQLGEMMQFGCMLLRVNERDGYLTLQEPDLQTIPIAWSSDITQSLRLLRLQKDVAESVGCGEELDSPSIHSSLLVGIDLVERSDTLFLERLDSETGDSGWFVGQPNSKLNYNDSDNLQRHSVYQAILNWPIIAGYLALPMGCLVELSRRSIDISRHGRRLEVRPGSYLDTVKSMQR